MSHGRCALSQMSRAQTHRALWTPNPAPSCNTLKLASVCCATPDGNSVTQTLGWETHAWSGGRGVELTPRGLRATPITPAPSLRDADRCTLCTASRLRRSLRPQDIAARPLRAPPLGGCHSDAPAVVGTLHESCHSDLESYPRLMTSYPG